MPVHISQCARAVSVTSGIRRGWYSVRSPESRFRRVRSLAAPQDSQRKAFRRLFRKLPISTNGPCSTPLIRGCPRHSHGIRNQCSCPSPYLIGLLLLHIHYIRSAGKRQLPQKILDPRCSSQQRFGLVQTKHLFAPTAPHPPTCITAEETVVSHV